ncbi:MAG: Na+/H+ antiporter subunit E, partial [Pseudomonadota bacterium]|nr:Na+/H+ antiporter subunit E [Pseudomonadota bacterium]
KLKILDDESLPIAILPRAIIYWIWLYKEILLSSIFVSKLILKFPLNISPKYFKIKSNQKTAMGFNIYANSITMTPGTISVVTNNAEKEIQIHAISEETKLGLESGVMDEKIKKLMGGKDV